MTERDRIGFALAGIARSYAYALALYPSGKRPFRMIFTMHGYEWISVTFI